VNQSKIGKSDNDAVHMCSHISSLIMTANFVKLTLCI